MILYLTCISFASSIDSGRHVFVVSGKVRDNNPAINPNPPNMISGSAIPNLDCIMSPLIRNRII